MGPSDPEAIAHMWWQCVIGDADALTTAEALYSRLRDTPSDPDFGWAALICGREAARRRETQEAERFFIEAVGSFSYNADPYGRAIAEAHFALTAQLRLNFDLALKFALAPFSSSVDFSDVDGVALHRLAAYVYWGRDEINASLLHSAKALEIARRSRDIRMSLTVLASIPAQLSDVAEPRLSAMAANEALRLADSARITDALRLTCMSNAVLCNTLAGNIATAEKAVRNTLLALQSGPPNARDAHRSLSIYYIATRQTDQARRHCALQRTASSFESDPIARVQMLLTEAGVYELEGHYEQSISASLEVLEFPIKLASRTAYREAGTTLHRCYSALRRFGDAAKWKRFASQHSHMDSLSNILTSQIEASLQHNPPNPLTAQELECLSLSARGQTSADIGLKLGIKPRTVNFHMSKILRKLNAMNRQEAIAKAITANFLRM